MAGRRGISGNLYDHCGARCPDLSKESLGHAFWREAVPTTVPSIVVGE